MMEIVICEPGRLEVRNAPDDSRLGPGDVLVEVRCLSLCGSDYKLFQGDYGGPMVYPVCFGHEWSGTVVRAPAGSRLAEGMEVTGDCSKWCGRCDLCQMDRNLCRSIEKFGITTDGFSRQVRAVPERYLYRNDFGLDHPTLALTEVCSVALHGIKRAQPLLDSSPVVIIGAGALGLITYLILTEGHRVRDVRLVEPAAPKRTLVERLVPTARFVEPPADTSRPLSYAGMNNLAICGLAFECSGTAAGLNAALALTRPLGTVVGFGLGRSGTVNTNLLVTKALRLLGSIGGTGEFPEAMQFLAAHREAASRLVTHRYRASRAQEALESTADAPTRLKVQLEF
jgi:threonine dehydrogenase-like Zn-dependent dehydrogenase